MIVEAVLVPASSGFGLWQLREGATTDYMTLADFEAHMTREYTWRWAPELDGLIQSQDGGHPFAWRDQDQTEADGWAYGIVW